MRRIQLRAALTRLLRQCQRQIHRKGDVGSDDGSVRNVASGCPHKAAASGQNPRNNMPMLKQRPWPGQSMSLDTNRVVSSIPKGEYTPEHQKKPDGSGDESKKSDSRWVYPSHQQFYNAMKIKGWDAREEDMQMVVAIHNAVNEKTWQKVCDIEQICSGSDATPKLVRFKGRPKDLTPKARMRMLMGYAAPFDRHDWFVERADGTEVRYVIDFYRGKSGSGETGATPFHGAKSIFLDVRPALDGPQGLIDRARIAMRNLFA